MAAENVPLEEVGRLCGVRDLSAADLAALTEHAPPRTFAAGEIVCREGDDATQAYFVVRGRLRASIDAGGRQETVNEIAPGEVTGESALFLTAGKRSATLTAAEPTVCLTLTRAALRAGASSRAVAVLEARLLELVAARVKRTDDLLVRAWHETKGSAPALRRHLGPVLGGHA